MKTPIQEAIENLDAFIGQGMSYSEWKKLTYSGKPSIERYLEKEKETMVDFAYSTRKLHSTTNHKCTCEKPNGVKDGGYCYAQDKMGNYRRPCELGMSIKDVLR